MIRGWLADETLRGRVETIALCMIMTGLGAGVGVVWSYVTMVQFGPTQPPSWAVAAANQLQVLLYVAGGIVLVGALVTLGLFLSQPDTDTVESA